jgi:hypothetical protein
LGAHTEKAGDLGGGQEVRRCCGHGEEHKRFG